MENVLIKEEQTNVEISSDQVGLILSESVDVPLVLKLPSDSEIKQITAESENLFSSWDILKRIESELVESLQDDLVDLELKKDKFKDSSTYWNHLASIAALTKGPKDAIQILKDGIKSTDDDFLKSRLADFNLVLGNENESVKALESLAKSDYRAQVRLALLDAKDKRFSDALQKLETVIENHPQDFETRLLAGALSLVVGSPDSGIRHFRVALSSHNNSSALYLNLAIAYIHIGKQKKAEQNAKIALSLNQLNKFALSLYADILIESQRFEEAVVYLKKYLSFDSKAEFAIERIARAFYLNGQYIEAYRALRKLAGFRENDPGVWNNIALTLAKTKNTKEAIKFFNHSISLMSKESPVNLVSRIYTNYIRFLFDLKRPKDVVAIATRYFSDQGLSNVAVMPSVSGALMRYIYSLSDIGAKEQSQIFAEKILQFDEITSELEESLVIFLTSNMSLGQNNKLKSLEYARRSVEIYKSSNSTDGDSRVLLLNNAAFAFLEANDLESVKPLIGDLKELASGNACATATLGLYNLRVGEIDTGRTLYEVAIGMSKDKLLKDRMRQKLNLELGRFFLKSKNPSNAAYHLKKASGPVAKFSMEAKALLAQLKG